MTELRKTYVTDATSGDTMDVNTNGSGEVTVQDASGNAMPAMDAVGRPGFIKVTDGTETLLVNADGSVNAVATATDLDIRDLSSAQDDVSVTTVKPDGTNAMPSMDTVARSGFVKVNDGTETLLVNADGSLNAVVTATDLDIRDLTSASDDVSVTTVKPDGTNTQPSMDAVGRAAYVNLTDGTESSSIITLTDDDTDIDGETALVIASSMFGRINSSTVKPIRIDGSTHAIKQVSYEHAEIHSNSHYFIEDYTTLGNAATLDFCVTTSASAKWPHLTFNYNSSLLMTLDIYDLSDFAADGTVVIPRANNRALTFSGQHDAVGSSATVMTDSTASFTVDALIGWRIFNHTDGSYGTVTDNDGTTVTVASLTGGTDNDWDQNDYYEINRSLVFVGADCTVNTLGMRIGGSIGGSGTNPSSGTPGGHSRSDELELRPSTSYLFRFTSGAAGNVLSYRTEWYEHEDKD